MATVNKNFRIKQGLVVEGATGTINGENILTETGSDQYILDLIGGETLVKSVSNEFNVSVAGELSIDRTTVDAYYDAAGSAATAQSNAEDYADGLASNYDAAGSAALAQSAAESYADGLVSSTAGDLTDHENATEAHGATGAVVGTTNTQTLSNKTISYTDNTITVQVANVSDLTASAAELNTLDGITASTAELNLLDGVTATTTELNYVDGVTSGIQGQLNDKAPLESPALTGTPLAPTATPGTNSTQIATTAYADAAVAALVDGAPALLNTLNELAAAINDDASFATTLTTSVGEKVSKSGDTMTGLLVLSADPSANLGAATKQYVDQAETDAISTASADATTKADAAQEAAEDYADGLASNYDPAGSAAAAQTAAESYADGLTDDMLDGSTPFTDLNINDVAKQVAARTTSLGSVPVTAYQFNKTNFKSGKFLVKIDNGTHNEISEILVTLDSSNNVAITEYAIVGTNGSRGTITADVDGTHCRIRVNPVNDSTITVSGTVFNA
jgi:hypothetical protein